MDLRRAARTPPAPPPCRGRGEWLMLSRSSAVIVSVTSLITGIVLGIVLARGGPVVSAQVAGRGQSEGRSSESRASKSRRCVAPEAQADDATYATLGKAVRAVSADQSHIRAGGEGGLANGRPYCRRKGDSTGVLTNPAAPGNSRRPAPVSSSEATAAPASTC